MSLTYTGPAVYVSLIVFLEDGRMHAHFPTHPQTIHTYTVTCPLGHATPTGPHHAHLLSLQPQLQHEEVQQSTGNVPVLPGQRQTHAVRVDVEGANDDVLGQGHLNCKLGFQVRVNLGPDLGAGLAGLLFVVITSLAPTVTTAVCCRLALSGKFPENEN